MPHQLLHSHLWKAENPGDRRLAPSSCARGRRLDICLTDERSLRPDLQPVHAIGMPDQCPHLAVGHHRRKDADPLLVCKPVQLLNAGLGRHKKMGNPSRFCFFPLPELPSGGGVSAGQSLTVHAIEVQHAADLGGLHAISDLKHATLISGSRKTVTVVLFIDIDGRFAGCLMRENHIVPTWEFKHTGARATPKPTVINSFIRDIDGTGCRSAGQHAGK